MPYVHIDLRDLDSSDLVDELEGRGYHVTKGPETTKELEGLDRIEHLACCGLLRDAQAEALALVGNAIGRRLN